jgi:hypothetical protein
MTIHNFTIGDRFYKGSICEVVDFIELKSIITGEIIGYQCIAVQVNGLAKNRFETPFSTVVRYKLNKLS